MHDPAISPSLPEFLEKCRQGNLITVRKEILADLETPVSAYWKVMRGDRGFLLESVEGGEQLGRYSFIGSEPQLVFVLSGRKVKLIEGPQQRFFELADGEDPLTFLQTLMNRYHPVPDPALPPFFGGLVGYMGYNAITFFEPLSFNNPDWMGMPDALFVLADSLVVFDRIRHTISLVANAYVEDNPEESYERAVSRIKELEARLQTPTSRPVFGADQPVDPEIIDNQTKEDFCQAVQKAKEYITAGDAFQIVPSIGRKLEVHCGPLDLYRSLRRINPSPYTFLLQNPEATLVGSSPEILVKVVGRKVQYRPIAGTRPRGASPSEDNQLEQELLADPKERAEHVMLVDLGRNDLGRVCEYNTVEVSDLMVIERYSHVMHIVSNVVGELAANKNPFDALRAVFPAGTLTGAPKIRAMEIIEELEPTSRGPYGGTVGYFSFNGNLDSCITIRTMFVRDNTVYLQAGAGVVYDSQPENEYLECLNKSKGLLNALLCAEHGKFF